MNQGTIRIEIITDDNGETHYQISNRPEDRQELAELSLHLGNFADMLLQTSPVTIH